MSSNTLGPGVRVYIGYTPRTALMTDEEYAVVCHTGTVLSGPFPPHSIINPERKTINPERSWLVHPDGWSRDHVYIVESMLTPIDDGDPDAERRQREREFDEWVAAGRPVPKVTP